MVSALWPIRSAARRATVGTAISLACALGAADSDAATWTPTQLSLPASTALTFQVVGIDGSSLVASTANGVFVFVEDANGQWSQQAQLSSAPVSDVAISGDTVAVAGVTGSAQGAVSMFVRSGTSWSLQQTLTASDGGPNDGFGGAVLRVSGDVLVATSSQTYIFGRTGTTWSQQAEIGVSPLAHTQVGIAGNMVLLSDSGFGKVYAYTQSGSTWGLTQTIVASDGSSSFGFAVYARGTTAIVSATGGASEGAVYIEQLVGSTWSEAQVVHAPLGAAHFGYEVALGSGMAVAFSASNGPVVLAQGAGGWSIAQVVGLVQPGSVWLGASGLTFLVANSQGGASSLTLYNPSPPPAPITGPSSSNPPVATGGGALTGFTPPAAIPLPSGYSLSGMTLTLTATSLSPVTMTWSSNQPFVVPSTGLYGDVISGETQVSITGSGTATYQLTGGLDGQTVTQAPPSPPVVSGVTPVALNGGPQSYVVLTAGTHDLEMSGTLVFTPAAVGDTCTASSAYQGSPVAAAASSAPALPRAACVTLWSLMLGVGALYAQRRTGPGRR